MDSDCDAPALPEAVTELVVIFAKRPVPGRVKTRLAEGVVEGLGALTTDHTARLYRAFLSDYARRFQDLGPGRRAVFCVRATEAEAFAREGLSGALGVLPEPRWRDRPAASIGEALAAALQSGLDQGAERVVALGSDLPHLPLDVLDETFSLLKEHPLVLGNDGGGCYVIAATGSAELLADPRIVWSKGEDYARLIELQAERDPSRPAGLLDRIVEDIDRPEELARLLVRLEDEPELAAAIPATVACLDELRAELDGAGQETTMTDNDTRTTTRTITRTITLNGERREVRAKTVGELFGELGIKREGCAVERNEEVIPRARLDDVAIEDGDTIELVRLVGGG